MLPANFNCMSRFAKPTLRIMTVNHLHLISGLPRSGSTLLCAILRQNPRFNAAMTSPVAMLWGALHNKMCDGEFSLFFDDAKRARMLRGVIDNYYADCRPDQIVF